MRSKNEFDDQLKSGVVKEGIVDRVRQYITKEPPINKHTFFCHLISTVNSGICELVFIDLQMIERSPWSGFGHLRFGGWPPMEAF